MGAILNGITLHGGFTAFGGTFLVFADFLRPTVRMAALMGIGTIFVLTHDSIAVGEDGPTHQPIEQIMSLRVIPNTTVFRPADALETAVAWQYACQHKNGPTAICLTRQKVPVLTAYAETVAQNADKGAYVLSPAQNEHRALTIIATGSEVSLALGAQKKLAAIGLDAAVVSMPSWEVFEEQELRYKESVLPAVPTFAVEAGVTLGWSRYTGSEKRVLGINTFGASAPGNIVMERYGMTVDCVVNMVKKELAK